MLASLYLCAVLCVYVRLKIHPNCVQRAWEKMKFSNLRIFVCNVAVGREGGRTVISSMSFPALKIGFDCLNKPGGGELVTKWRGYRSAFQVL